MKAPDYSWAELGERVRDLRIERGLSQQELADAAEITQAGLHRIESGQTNPQLDSLQRIAAALGTSVRYLVTGAPSRATLLWLWRIARILQSGDELAMATLQNAIVASEALLARSGRKQSPDQPPGRSVDIVDLPRGKQNKLLSIVGQHFGYPKGAARKAARGFVAERTEKDA